MRSVYPSSDRTKGVILCTGKQHAFTRSNIMKNYEFLCFVIVFTFFLCVCVCVCVCVHEWGEQMHVCSLMRPFPSDRSGCWVNVRNVSCVMTDHVNWLSGNILRRIKVGTGKLRDPYSKTSSYYSMNSNLRKTPAHSSFCHFVMRNASGYECCQFTGQYCRSQRW
jgi:hypothetical protein